ncbi:hypothetical protein [Paenibacillus sp.]|uniref:hypothetical protein n=1 Tax=Paenibacillus sp. TaxID=58172 RepID=UPI00356274A4
MRKKLLVVLASLGALIIAAFFIANKSFSIIMNSISGGSSLHTLSADSTVQKQPNLDKSTNSDNQVAPESNSGSIQSSNSTENHGALSTSAQNEKKEAGPITEAKGSTPSAPDAAKSSAESQVKPNGNTTQYSATISEEKAEKVKDEITIAEKAKITSMLLSKLSPSELKLFAQMASNGLSLEEKKEAKKIILNKLSEDEYNQLIGIAAKYGLSQGKNYADSKKQDLSNKQDTTKQDTTKQDQPKQP